MARNSNWINQSPLETGVPSTQKQSLPAACVPQKPSAKIRRAITTIQTKGMRFYAQSYLKKRLTKNFLQKKEKFQVGSNTWKAINFKALELHGEAKILLNPQDMGFSREFNVYGFREPLNTYALFCSVGKHKPVVLDIGGNLGYFTLIELAAGAKKVIAVEPVPSTFKFLSKTLENYKKVELLNLAISDSKDNLTLYVGKDRNVTSSFKQLFVNTGHPLDYEITVRSETVQSMAEKYPISMLRMDVEGHEYRILSERIPDQINIINVELHVLPPFNKNNAVHLLRCLFAQNFRVHVAIKEINYEYYSFIERFGLRSGYNLAATFGSSLKTRPSIKLDPSFDELIDSVPEEGQIHLILER